jgi:hypothetical protein
MSIVSAERSATDQIDDPEQHDGAEKRYEERSQRERRVVDVSAREDQPADSCADNSHYDVEEEALLCVGDWRAIR